MRRRKFIKLMGGAALAWPLVARAQQSPSKVWRVAYLYPGFRDNPVDHAIFDVFRAEMRELGYIEGKNLVIDTRTAEGKFERLPALTDELIALRPDVIVAIATPAIAAAHSCRPARHFDHSHRYGPGYRSGRLGLHQELGQTRGKHYRRRQHVRIVSSCDKSSASSPGALT